MHMYAEDPLIECGYLRILEFILYKVKIHYK